eukprot:8936861-Pyramimonas_sp.AAC.1
MTQFIPSNTGCFKSSHPWLDAACVSLVRKSAKLPALALFLQQALRAARAFTRARLTWAACVLACALLSAEASSGGASQTN